MGSTHQHLPWWRTALGVVLALGAVASGVTWIGLAFVTPFENGIWALPTMVLGGLAALAFGRAPGDERPRP